MPPPEKKRPETTKCPKCAVEVPKRNFCSRCGQELVPAKDWLKQILDPQLFTVAAKTMKESFDRINLATVQFIHIPENGTHPQIKPVEIDSGTHAFIARSETSSLERLPPGRYPNFEDLFGRTGGAGGIRNASDKNTCLFVKVNCRPITATFRLPDWQLVIDTHLANKQFEMIVSHEPDKMLKNTLEQLNLLSGDNLFGGALAQLEIQVIEPQELLNALGDVMVEEGNEAEKNKVKGLELRGDKWVVSDKADAILSAQNKELDNTPTTETIYVPKASAKTRVGKMFQWLGRKIFGEKLEAKTLTKRSKSQTFPFNFTLTHLYERIRLEFRMAVQQALKDFQAIQLLENRDEGRNAVRNRIEEVMNQTLKAYGIRLNRCMTFEFVCPELLTLHREKGETRIAEERLEEQSKRMKLNQKTALLTREQERFDQLLDFEDAKIGFEQARVLEQMEDENKAAAQVRQLEMDATQGQHDREQKEKTKILDISLQKQEGLALNEVEADKEAKRLEGYRQYMEIQQGAKDQEFDKLLELAKVLPTLSPQMQQAMIAALKPELQAMFIAAYQASGLEQQIAMQREHTKELGDAHTHGTQQGVQLLTAIVQQAGTVLAAKAAADAAASQQPRQFPTSDPDATIKEGGAQ
jgi:hypothetical protein